MALIPPKPRTYNPAKLVVIVGGKRITGLAKGDDAVSVKYNTDEVSLEVGCSGEPAYTVSPDRSGEITIKVMKTSPDNAYLRGLLQAQRLGDNLNTNIVIQDLNGVDLYATAFARFAKSPDRQWGEKAAALEWRFITGRLTDFAGGNL